MPQPRPAIWLICGGQSPEHDISISSGRTAAAQLDRLGYAITPVYIRRDGMWAVADAALDANTDVNKAFEALMEASRTLDAGEALALARRKNISAALLILHGAHGEDGTIQGLFEMAGIPYAGSGVLASSLAMDKVRCQQFLRGAGMPVAPFVFDSDAASNAAALAERAQSEIGFPCVVKPSRAGSSVGVTIVRGGAELLPAIERAAAVDQLVMVEQFVSGEELTCGVIEREVDGRMRPQVLPVTAIRPKHSAFFDYTAKYTPGESEEITPAPIAPDQTEEIQRLALRTFELLGCRDMARVDFILASDGPCLLEINTIPGLTPTSLLPQQAAAVGIRFPELLDVFVRNAMHRKATAF